MMSVLISVLAALPFAFPAGTSGLVQVPDGSFYGVTSGDGAFSSGTIFKVTLPAYSGSADETDNP